MKMITLKTKNHGNHFRLPRFSISNIFTDGFPFIRSILFYFIIGIAVLFGCLSVEATDNQQTSAILTLRADQNFYEISQHIEMLQDATAELTIQDVSSDSMSTKFTPVRSRNINFGLWESASIPGRLRLPI